MREGLNDVGGNFTAQYGLEAAMPKAAGGHSDFQDSLILCLTYITVSNISVFVYCKTFKVDGVRLTVDN